ncbi:glutathione ABC transporter substrate-binding protein [Chelativorans sp. M5D2P16]|uniref:glutathione ABC transporter substrate-binding protein n=1 Tax=Chelativorans sp. M5D2P16 TaxID=3095678 RepID=UPI002ACA93A9|nr:glutathione ABC transporter substrate-binding protein [Chelativorans sp. M5D2P16]MDZ5695980.1 glutathione ABC transporter substrate-binding protein [Chelativorans sp. M5D2P16]
MKFFKRAAFSAALFAGSMLSIPAVAADLSIAMDQIFQKMDPHNSNYNVDYSAASGVLERLIGFDKNMKLVPQLATSWEGSDDAKTFTFKLREGVKFHDGTDFNAAAVKANFDRLADQSRNLAKNSLFKVVDKVETPDDYTVVLKLKEPFGAMINTVAHPSVVIHSPKALEEFGKDVEKHPVGTGPFKFKEWIPGERLVLEKNEDYWDSEWPKVDKVTFYPVTESSTRVSMLLSDEVQFIHILPAELADSVESSGGYEVLEVPGITVWTASMNMLKDHFKDERVRRAFNLAVDQQAFVGVVYSGHGVVPDSPIAPDTRFYESQGPLKTDIEEARRLMKEAGYEDGFDIAIWGVNNSTGVRMLQFLQQQLSQINVRADIVPMEGATRSEKVFSSMVPEKAEFDMLLGGWSPSTGDADWHLRPVYATEGWIPKIYNMAFYSNETVDEAIQEALNTADPEKRREAYSVAQKQIWKDAPVVWLAIENKMAARKKGLSGVFQMPDGTMQFTHAAYE